MYSKDFFRCCNELCLSPQARAKISIVGAKDAGKDKKSIMDILGDDEEKEATMQYMATIITLEQNLLKGDVNQDGVVGLYDAFQILRTVILGDGDLSEDEQYIMDYNDDGEVGLYDAFQFLRQVILS